MKKDILAQGAIVQRDKTSYAIAPHLPGGIVSPAVLRTIADVAERYGAAMLKLTSAQRIAILGLPEAQLDQIWQDLGVKPGAPIGLCVRSVKICPGTTFCKRGQQNSVEVGLRLDQRYHGMALPWKFKMGVSGCMNDCGETCIKDLGLIGTTKGWNVMVGGNGGGRPRLALKLAENLPSEAEAVAVIAQVIAWFKAKDRRCRIGKLIEELGEEAFRREIMEQAAAPVPTGQEG